MINTHKLADNLADYTILVIQVGYYMLVFLYVSLLSTGHSSVLLFLFDDSYLLTGSNNLLIWTHMSSLLGTGGCAAGATRCGSQQPPAAQQAQPGTRQTPGGHLELVKAPPGWHTAPNTASGRERVGLAKAAATGQNKSCTEASIV